MWGRFCVYWSSLCTYDVFLCPQSHVYPFLHIHVRAVCSFVCRFFVYWLCTLNKFVIVSLWSISISAKSFTITGCFLVHDRRLGLAACTSYHTYGTSFPAPCTAYAFLCATCLIFPSMVCQPWSHAVPQIRVPIVQWNTSNDTLAPPIIVCIPHTDISRSKMM